ncbi:hypothetical protein FSHL1_002608 [Fusarium sambucinum]
MVALKSILLVILTLSDKAFSAATGIPRATITVKNQANVMKKVFRNVNVIGAPQPRTTTEAQIYETTLATVTSTTVASYSTSTVKTPNNFKYLLNFGYYAPKLKFRDVKQLSPHATTSQYPQRLDCTKNCPSTTVKTIVVKTETVTLANYPPKVARFSVATVSPTVTVHDTVARQTVATKRVIVQTMIPANPYYEACGSDAFLKTANLGNTIILYKPVQASINQQYYFSGDTSTPYTSCIHCNKNTKCFLAQT